VHAAASDPSIRPGHPSASDWIGLGDASTLLGVSAATLRRWSDEGRIPVFTTPGGHRRYSRRALAAMIPSVRRERPPLARLGASAERIVRAYRRPLSRRRWPAARQPWVARLSESQTAEFRQRGRDLVEALLLHLDRGPAGAAEHLDRAIRLAAEHGRMMAELGCSTLEAVESFLQFRAPFLAELARLARRRGLDTREATALLAAVESALDRLLVATVEGHAGALAPAPVAVAPGAAAHEEVAPGAAAREEVASGTQLRGAAGRRPAIGPRRGGTRRRGGAAR
jgi:DNA-binding transcriptional MerR regulator